MKTTLLLFGLCAAAVAQPTISSVIDGGAYTQNIAQGSVFVVKGTGLSADGFVQATAPTYPTTLNNVRVTLTPVSGGATVAALMVNTFNMNGVNQVVAVLPSNAALGAYNLKLENGAAASVDYRVIVVARKPGIVTTSSDGKGPAQATIGGGLILIRTSNLGQIGQFTSRSVRLGERVDLWGTGLGADLASDTGGSSGDLTAAGTIRVLVNGREITPAYAGRSQGFPGLDQVVFTLPTDAAQNCTVDLQVRAGGVLSNAVTIATTGTGDACPAATSAVRFNEAESNGDAVGDWAEVHNPSNAAINIGGYGFRDTDATHTIYRVPANTMIAAGGYFVFNDAEFGFGLGTTDGVILYAPGSDTVIDSYQWRQHAATTYGRCPNGSGPYITTNAPTKGAANDCTLQISINEVESSGGTPGDWVELFNRGTVAIDISGFGFKDDNDGRTFEVLAGTTVAPGAYHLLEEAAFGFGLGGADSARLYDAGGNLVDSYEWTAHAATTYGRCPNGVGAFTTTTSSTKGAANDCPGAVTFLPWPGGTAVAAASPLNAFGGDLSGLTYEARQGGDVIWGSRNGGPGALFRLLLANGVWTPDATNDWQAGKALRFPGGGGEVDAEGLTYSDTSANGIYVASERNNSASSVSKNSILRFDPAAPGATLTATHEWDITADIPATGANTGLEAIAWIPDSVLTARNFFDVTKNKVYAPADYPNHGTGLFFVGVEASGDIHAYALSAAGTTFNKIATFTSGFPSVMDLHFDRDRNELWAICDNTCNGRSTILRIDNTGRFVVAERYERPTGLGNLNNEGFTIAPITSCAADARNVFWADDDETDGLAIRRGTITCPAVN